MHEDREVVGDSAVTSQALVAGFNLGGDDRPVQVRESGGDLIGDNLDQALRFGYRRISGHENSPRHRR